MKLELTYHGVQSKEQWADWIITNVVACRKTWISKDLGQRRKNWLLHMLARYPDPEDWKRVRFQRRSPFLTWAPGQLMINPTSRGKILRKLCPNCLIKRIRIRSESTRGSPWIQFQIPPCVL